MTTIKCRDGVERSLPGNEVLESQDIAALCKETWAEADRYRKVLRYYNARQVESLCSFNEATNILHSEYAEEDEVHEKGRLTTFERCIVNVSVSISMMSEKDLDRESLEDAIEFLEKGLEGQDAETLDDILEYVRDESVDAIVRSIVGFGAMVSAGLYGNYSTLIGKIMFTKFLSHNVVVTTRNCMYVSKFFNDDRDNCYDLMKKMGTEKMDWNEWIVYMMTALKETITYDCRVLFNDGELVGEFGKWLKERAEAMDRWDAHFDEKDES